MVCGARERVRRGLGDLKSELLRSTPANSAGVRVAGISRRLTAGRPSPRSTVARWRVQRSTYRRPPSVRAGVADSPASRDVCGRRGRTLNALQLLGPYCGPALMTLGRARAVLLLILTFISPPHGTENGQILVVLGLFGAERVSIG